MSYNTNPLNVYARVEGELNYAETLPIQNRPRIWVGCETHCGVGINVSYCDTPDKNSKDTVNKDISTIEALVASYTSYTGFNIHDWEGWKNLTPLSSLTTDPLCSNPTSARFEIISKEEIQVYPNPSKGLVNINNIPENTILEVFNIVGELVFRKEFIGTTHTISLQKKSGIYLLKFHVGDNIQFKKVVIE
ncbi:MAG: T9SS type A sorting domain-containing protein [Vicingus serpentipes]|nr:T9SS type A sorting domain-containing protein [Vicingus serpentipes]